MKKTVFILACCCLWSIATFADSFDYNKLTPHPRLVFTAGEEVAVKKTISESKPVMAVHERIMKYADETLTEPTAFYRKNGKRLLGVSRQVLRRVTHLSYAYRMTKDERYAVRALQEMKAACRFDNWNPSHFLDTGEMTMAIAIGYDWLYGWLTPADKKELMRGIVKNGFEAADERTLNMGNNWNSVCNAGITYGALALFEEMPDVAKKHIEKTMVNNPVCLEVYGPDGGYPEGYNYWSYGTSFQVMLMEGLQTALGTDGGLSQYPGVLQSARFEQYMCTPTGSSFNFYDTVNRMQCNTMEFWFARQLNDPSLLYLEIQNIDNPDLVFEEDNRLLPMLPIFASRIDLSKISKPTSSFWFNRGKTPVFIYRGGWDSKEDTYFAIKGGTASSSHAHMDAGTFVFEKNGERWAADLGSQNYLSLESRNVDLWNMEQNSQRWEVFRYNNRVHNTLTVDNQLTNVAGKAEIVKTFQTKSKKGAVVDLTPVYEGQLQSAVRTAVLDAKDNLTITDKVRTGSDEALIAWRMVTAADARIVGDNCIELTLNGKKMLLTVKSPAKVEMKVWSNEPEHDYDSPNPGTVRVGFEVKAKANSNITLTTTLQ